MKKPKQKSKNNPLLKLENWIRKTYKATPKDKLYLKVANLIKSSNSSERYFSLSEHEYIIENRDWDYYFIVPESAFKDKEEMKVTKIKCKNLIREVIEFPSKLVFSLMDQSYSPLGTDGFWKYSEKWDDETFEFKPRIAINKSGKLIGGDGKPLFGFHFSSPRGRIYKNILFTDLTKASLKRAKILLLKQNLIPLKEFKKQKFLLVVSPEIEFKAKEIEHELMKEKHPDDLLVTPYLKKLNWAIILESPAKPLIFQLRSEPDFCVNVKRLFAEEFEKKTVIDSNMRCNAGIGDWKKIVGSFKKEVENEIFN